MTWLSAVSARSALIVVIVFSFMMIEARRAARNERAQRANGGIEPPGDVYSLMQIAYPGVFLAMIVDGARRATPVAEQWFIIGAATFLAAKTLKWWAITTLGRCWTFRVIVVPGTVPVQTGPYRFVRHPNYVAVIGEIVGAALMTGARVSGPIALLVFGALMLRRIAVENRALNAILRRG
jgi:methyltransferase